MWRRFSVFVALLTLATWGSAQSLGDVARKEKERREKNKTRGVEVREFAEDDIFEVEDQDSEGESSESAEDPEADETETESPAERRIDLSVERGADTERLDRERQDRRREEAEWRSRFQQARTRVSQARQRQELLAGLHLAQGESYVDAEGRTVVESLEHLRRLVREADEELAAAEEALADLREEARRAGVPPGWTR